ncbi:FAD:protein FMN transferase [Marinobacterium nitratireducens]|uniref:FAD:protein FMN transferase n=1 Tax=Marinobacterium nitratireducens TaxID=518897 RepID=A0A918DSG3_9GAMM|nr:FAD:protein FMN transferase [Marinobacterium nitratireducens]GGO80520.1 FAD:protein FMN transferase [Marinobacterium nitratireducens]
MGTTFSVKWVSNDPGSVERIAPKLEQSLAAVNQSMSTYMEDSELSVLNREPAGSVTEVSEGLFQVLSLSQRISESSDGAFDVTVGPLVNLWGFGPDGRITHAPEQAEIDRIRAHTGYRKLHLDPNGRKVTRDAALYVDLSGIAKGYGVDELARVLEGEGVDSYLVEVGGELRARGTKPDGSPWRIAIESPVAGERDVQRIIEVHEIGVATSGDYRNYFEENGIRFSHTIDPATGRPISHKLASVTVLSPTCAEADGLATMFTVMGAERGFQYAVDNGVAAFFIVKSDEGFVERMTPAFEPYLTE